jgi:uncharacterized membrane protein YdjX (TVP38/TMEM64 family)
MIEGILILVGIASYVSIVKVVNDHRSNYTQWSKSERFFGYLLCLWVVIPFWVVFKFWEWLLITMPEQVKDWWMANRK